MGHWGVSEFGKVELKSVVGDFSGVFHAQHVISNLHVHPPISGECAKIVLRNNFFRDDGKGNFNILVPVHRCVVIIFLNVQCEEPGIGCRHCTVEQELSLSHNGKRCGDDTGKIQFVTTHGDNHSVCFSLVGLDTGHKLGVGDLVAGWNVAAKNKKDCVSASGHVCANTLGDVGDVVGEVVGPDVLVRPLYEVKVFQGVAGHLVDDRVCRARGIFGYKDDR